MSHLDEFVMHSASTLLRLLHEYFAVKDFIDPSEFDIKEIDWKKVVADDRHMQDVNLIIRYMPECIPFDVRALFFTKTI